MTRIDREVETLTGELLSALDRYRDAKRRFVERTNYYRSHYTRPSDADIAAQSDYQRKTAVVDCEWFRGEVLVAASALTALLMLGEDDGTLLKEGR